MRLKRVFGIILIIFFTSTQGIVQAKTSIDSTPPKVKTKVFRIAYYEGGEYSEYKMTLLATIQGLMNLGWIEKVKIPFQIDMPMKKLWDWLAMQSKSKSIEFVLDAYYSAGWNNEERVKTQKALIKRFNTRKDIDLVIAMGTWAGQDLANNDHHVPTIVMAASDPIASNIIKSIDDPGFEHLHARVDPYRYERQMQIFFDIIGFKKLGMAFKNNVAGRSYAAIDKVEKIAKENGFTIVPCHIKDGTTEEEQGYLLDCFKELTQKVDAIYVTAQKGVNKTTLPQIVKICNNAKIPTFSQAGSSEVKYGLLMSISQAGFKYVGNFHAETIAKVLNGAKPSQLNQVFEDPPKIALNLMTADKIQYDPPVDVLGAADEIFEEIVDPSLE